MGKNKLSKFADLETFSCVLQYPYARLESEEFPYKGSWRTEYFASPSSPLVIELGCGRGEYTVALAASNPGSLYVGFDRKGARLCRCRGGSSYRNAQCCLCAYRYKFARSLLF